MELRTLRTELVEKLGVPPPKPKSNFNDAILVFRETVEERKKMIRRRTGRMEKIIVFKIGENGRWDPKDKAAIVRIILMKLMADGAKALFRLSEFVFEKNSKSGENVRLMHTLMHELNVSTEGRVANKDRMWYISPENTLTIDQLYELWLEKRHLVWVKPPVLTKPELGIKKTKKSSRVPNFRKIPLPIAPAQFGEYIPLKNIPDGVIGMIEAAFKKQIPGKEEVYSFGNREMSVQLKVAFTDSRI